MDSHSASDDEQPQEQSIRAIRKKQVKAPAKKKAIKKKPINNMVRVSERLKEAVSEKFTVAEDAQGKQKQPELLHVQPTSHEQRTFQQSKTVSRKVQGLHVIMPARTYQPSKSNSLFELAFSNANALRVRPSFLRRLRKH